MAKLALKLAMGFMRHGTTLACSPTLVNCNAQVFSSRSYIIDGPKAVPSNSRKLSSSGFIP
jgi:hypothetical protein